MKFLLTALLILIHSSMTFAEDDFQTNLNNYISFHSNRAENLILNRDKIIAVEVIITGRSYSLASSFGHTLLRFVYKDALPSNVSILSFVARPDEPTFSTWKAATSQYSFVPEVMSLQEVWKKYYEKQNREMTRYVLNLSPEQLDHFIDTAIIYIQNPEKLKGYNFFKNNCMGAVSRILIESDLTKSTNQAIFPNNAHNWLKKNNLTNSPGIRITSSDITSQE